MDHYSEMSIFIAVAEENGLAAAARRLHQSAPTITRAIAGLEQRLGVRLLERSTRGVQLTEAGQRYCTDCKRILADIQDAESSAAGSHLKPEGRLNIAAPLLFGQDILTPVVLDYLDEFPNVQARTSFMDRFPNLHEEGFDVAVLMGELPDSSLIAVKVGNIRRIIIGSPAYLHAHGTPMHPAELQKHALLVSMADNRQQQWSFIEQGEMLNVNITPRWLTSTNTSAITAASNGAGLTRVMSYQVRAAIQENKLQVVLPEFETDNVAVHIVYREGRRAAARVRSFVDYAVQRLRAESW